MPGHRGTFRILAAIRDGTILGGVTLYGEPSRFGTRVETRSLLYYNGFVLRAGNGKYPSLRTALEDSTLAALEQALGRLPLAHLSLKGRGARRHRQLHPWLLQPDQAAFFTRLPVSQRLRKETGSRVTPPVNHALLDLRKDGTTSLRAAPRDRRQALAADAHGGRAARRRWADDVGNRIAHRRARTHRADRHRARRWPLRPDRLQQIRQHGRAHGTGLANPDYPRWAASLGVDHVRMEGLPSLRRAVAAKRSTLLKVEVRDSVAIRTQQVKGLARATALGGAGASARAWWRSRRVS